MAETNGRLSGRRPTMVDVARTARVGLGTVSRVVNRDPAVRPELVARVNKAIAAMGYQPDERARQLRRGVSGTLGAAVRGISRVNPVLRAVERAARKHELMLLATSTEDDEGLEKEVVLAMCRRRFDGLIIEPTGARHDYLLPELEAGLAVVAIDRPIRDMEVDAVVCDNRGGIEVAFRHLVERGHQRIGYIGDHERIFTGRERARAFRRCLAAAGSRVDGLVHTGDDSDTVRIGAALDSIFGGRWPATALITGNANVSIQVIGCLRSAPRPVAIVGFDDSEIATLLRPDLTVVAQDTEAIGETAVDLLRARAAEPGLPAERVTIPVTLVPRGSGESRPA
jgi:LacI family transcriptional regulator